MLAIPLGRPCGHWRAKAQYHIVFPIPTISVNGGADALVRSRPPGRLLDRGKHLIHRGQERDEGVPPRTRGSAPPLVLSPTSRKLCGIGLKPAPPKPRRSGGGAGFSPPFSTQIAKLHSSRARVPRSPAAALPKQLPVSILTRHFPPIKIKLQRTMCNRGAF
jgi:hypothetical protein